ncbi:hypothetical protein [Vibrio misgurnus]|uniref:hypothetical protein n=1 Tax=Vibrio misgurnus TaxID=2993714 RepID=UPI0023F87912|nr:hypothetical protein [Vibrio sp. VCS]
MASLLQALARLLNALLDAINRSRKVAAGDAPSEHIANGGRVQHSDKTFADLANPPKRD